MKMIYKYIYVTLCAVALAFLGCTEYEEVVDPPFVLPFDKIEASGTDTTEKILHFGSSSSSYQYSVTADVEWINIRPEGFAAWNIIIPQNETVFERKGTITVMVVDGYFGAKYSQTIKVTQSKGEARAETNVLQFSADADEKYLLIKTNLPNYKISVDKSWVTLGKSNGEGGENVEEVWVRVSTNPNNSYRSATISIQSGQSKLPVATITQEAMTYVWDVLSGNDYTVDKYNEVVLEADEYAKSYTVAIRTNLSWKCSITSSSGNLGSDWITVETPKCDVAMSSSATTTYLKFKLDDNRDYRRQVTLKVSATNNSGKSAFIVINQEAIPHLSLAQESVQLGGSAGDHSMDLGAGDDWSATCDADWLTLTNSSGTPNDRTLNFSVTENTTEPKRTATIKLGLTNWEKESVEMTVVQTCKGALYYTQKEGTTTPIALQGSEPFDTAILVHEYDPITCEGGITFEGTPTKIGESAFANSQLTSITLPNTIKEIGYEAFANSQLSEITLHDGLEMIDGCAFSGCKISSINIPSSVRYIESAAFANTYLNGVHITDLSAWCQIEYGNNYAANPLYRNGKLYLNGEPITELTIPSDVTRIKKGAFQYFTDLESVVIHDGVTEIGGYAFHNCTNLKSVSLGNGVQIIRWVAFGYCESLQSITIPDSVNAIEAGAFHSCKSLQSFNGKFASLDNRCLSVGSTLRAFAPKGITSYTIPGNPTIIDEYTFMNCKELTSVVIPESVRIVIEYAFSYCNKLEEINCKAINPPVLKDEDIFEGSSANLTIYVPYASVEAYQTAKIWSNYASKIVGKDF